MGARNLSKGELAGYIDHTALKADTTPAAISDLCDEAREYSFAAVCINPSFVPQAVAELEGTDVAVCTVIGFPLGATSSEVKAAETRWAVKEGATEVDMVINVGLLKAGLDDRVRDDIRAVVAAAQGGATVKVIIECALLNDEEKRLAVKITREAGAHYVKTSTGFSSGGATLSDVRLLREAVGPGFGVKAAGGIGDYEAAIAMIEAGATRLGASAGVRIVSGATDG